ncbi:hypothetical protein [Caballeronia sp. DA-9]|uniref:hypothetical protein n=1 Tax=Caballeronia sp. DA-9 TaxID=3436237 RepID=UPI003F677276
MKTKYRTVSLAQATAMYSGKLINDFSINRVRSGWAIFLFMVGNEEITVLRDDEPNAEEPGKIFDTADAALIAAYKIGFEVFSIGQFRLGFESNKHLLESTMNSLRRAAGKIE